MTIDVHTHIFPPEVVRDRDRFFDREPAFRLLYESPKSKLVTAEGLLEAMDEQEVERSITFGFPWVNPETAARHNDYVLDAAVRHGSRLVPLACFDVLSERAPAEAERCLRAGAAGLGELALYGRCDPRAALERFEPVVDCCRSEGGMVMVHANEPVGHMYPGKAPLPLDFYYDLARLASGVPLVFAHWGGGLCFYELLKKEAREVLADVRYDTAASPFVYNPDIYPTMLRLLGEKILFGSDYPLIPPRRYFKEMGEAGLTPEQLERLTGGNAARLLEAAGANRERDKRP
jgi:hypothetical protein